MKPHLPDVASDQRPQHATPISWVGMSSIALPLRVTSDDSKPQQVQAKAQTFVNLTNPAVKGIHMSRLYLLLADFARSHSLSAKNLREFLSHLLDSHEDISTKTQLDLSFDYLLDRPALKSEYSGFKGYPICIRAHFDGQQVVIELSIKIAYSSTCPCSAALARQLIQQAFKQDFADTASLSLEDVEHWLRSEQGSSATPHSQRSYANIWVKLPSTLDTFPILHLINTAEQALATAVQTAVKREDEQEFARLNGHNLMFCEDAARRLTQALNRHKNVFEDFWLRVDHLESLHAHDATAIAVKGIAEGYQALLHR
jgi:GTP cyclohydrolase I